MQFVVRFDRTADSSGPDVVSITADHYTESYREGALAAYRFLDGEGQEVAMVRAARVTYIAVAGVALEPVLERGPMADVADRADL